MNFQFPIKKNPLIISIILLQIINASQSAIAVGVTPPLTKCNIMISDPHLSESLMRTRGIHAVKVNARSKCNKPMSNLVLTVEIYKIGFLRDHRVGFKELIVKGPIATNKITKNQETFAQCKNTHESRFYGIAYATALVEGKSMKTLHVITERTIPLACGT